MVYLVAIATVRQTRLALFPQKHWNEPQLVAAEILSRNVTIIILNIQTSEPFIFVIVFKIEFSSSG